jgi:hypothetical protein
MINKKFEVYKVKRELKRSGIEYELKRPEKNVLKEPTGGLVSVGKFLGLYHEQNSYVKITTGDAAQTRSKKVPMILCLYEDIASFDIKVEDIVIINKKTFKVTGIINIQEWNLIADISLEVVDIGIQT